MRLCYILEDTDDLFDAIGRIVLDEGLAYDYEENLVVIGLVEVTFECDPSDAVEIERILAPLM